MIGGKVSQYLDPIVKFYFIIFQAHFKPTRIYTVIEKLNWLMPLAGIKVSYFRCFKRNISNAISSDAIKWIIINIKKEKILCYSVTLYFPFVKSGKNASVWFQMAWNLKSYTRVIFFLFHIHYPSSTNRELRSDILRNTLVQSEISKYDSCFILKHVLKKPTPYQIV